MREGNGVHCRGGRHDWFYKTRAIPFYDGPAIDMKAYPMAAVLKTAAIFFLQRYAIACGGKLGQTSHHPQGGV